MENLLCRTLSPGERYSAMRNLHTDSAPPFLSNNKWLAIIGWLLILVLLILFFVVRRIRLEKERLAMEKRFLESSGRCQLTAQEREILETICRYANAAKKDDVFSDTAVFDAGFAALIQKSFEAGHNLTQRKQLNVIIQGIRIKLGHQKSQSTLNCTVRESKQLSSRQIPQNSSVLVELISKSKVLRFEATVALNDTCEIVLSPAMAVEATPGQTANIQYCLGSVVWTFETVVISCGSHGLELNHSDQVKFVNRRRFPRTVVQKKAKIAVFNINSPGNVLNLPVFIDAIVTEISGPGLRIQTDMDLKSHDRILVVLEVEPGRILQDVADVRGIRDSSEGRSVGVEMLGLNESSLNDLFRISNTVMDSGRSWSIQEGTGEMQAASHDKGTLV
jgi:hypothetical protein